MYRQGDVLLLPVKSAPKGWKLAPVSGAHVALALGEVTGHAHVVPSADCSLMVAPDNLLTGESAAAMIMRLGGGAVLDVKRATCLTHEEHAKVDLPPGKYRVVIQREYSLGESRIVRD